jgi:hypothetical protein
VLDGNVIFSFGGSYKHFGFVTTAPDELNDHLRAPPSFDLRQLEMSRHD